MTATRLIIVVLACLVAAAGCGTDPPPPPPPPTVVVDTPQRRDVTTYYEYSGTLAPVQQVELRARVSGFVESVDFEASTDVEPGQLLFQIETEPYAIALALAEAEAARAEARRIEAASIFERLQEAFDRGAATNAERIESQARVRQREAELAAAMATVRQAELDLSYTRVRAPIAGRIGRRLVDVGDLVGADGPTLLTTILQMDPVWVYLDVSERIVLDYLERGNDGSVGEDGGPPIELARSNDPEGAFPFSGVIDFVDNRVDEATGTIRVRGVIDNPDGRLFPGLFVRCRVPNQELPGALLIDQNAVGTSLDGKFVIVVDDQGVAQRRRVVLGPAQTDGSIVVESGLEADERYVVRGLQYARPGSPVTAMSPEQFAAQSSHAAAGEPSGGGTSGGGGG